MIRLAITPAACEAIIATLPEGAALWPVERQGGQCFIHVEAAVVDRLAAMRGPGDDYSDVILRLVESEASGPNGNEQKKAAEVLGGHYRV